MTAAIDQRTDKIKEIVCEVLEMDTEEVTNEGLFKEEYGADSLLSIEILSSLEKEFGIVIEQAEMSRMVNMTGVFEVVGEAIDAK